MSLLSAAERFASIDHSSVVLDVERCLHTHDRNSVCEECYAICPVDAIASGRPPRLDSERCKTCLACLTVCPTGAFAADDSVQMLLNAVARVEDGVIELLCKKNPHAELGVDATSTGIRIHGCLAGLGAGAYTALIALGRERILVRTEACSECEWLSLAPKIDSQVKVANRILGAWGRDGVVSSISSLNGGARRPFWDVDNPPLSRRDLFRMISKQGQIAMARAMENGITTSRKQPGRDRLRLLSAVSHLHEYSPDPDFSLEGLGFATVAVSETCTACGVCARACPTAAIQFQKNEEETTYTLSFVARLCIGCEMCEHVCMPLAVQVEHDPAFVQVFGVEKATLREGELGKCSQCGILMAKRSDTRLCSLCQYRRKHAFGSVLPPGRLRNTALDPENKQ